ncbi:MAG: toxin-antitoxin system YwqK family antitoxin [Spirobacillus cienkowskii]|jgi:antitoxin component YwqK of YwqJK toxin-antitoxin module|uniref:Toxin-antitoxin system YwqK family antitoxin n=1 Tax=Spirobacillus cienkowskii TaxID=495820 RepID=A0A369KQI7_9BACT|nr:MAG: toxin-antitoxin system YwqK family antitoxin [Spirobacillus cienkowskii]
MKKLIKIFNNNLNLKINKMRKIFFVLFFVFFSGCTTISKIEDKPVNKSLLTDNNKELNNDKNKKEIERNIAPKLEDLKKMYDKIYIYEKDFIKLESNNITHFLDIKTKEPISGIGISLYENGVIKRIIVFKNGFVNGFDRNYYESGKIKDESLYKDGIPYGTGIIWYENGNIKSTVIYQNQNGLLNIELTEHDENGNIKIIVKAQKIEIKIIYKYIFDDNIEEEKKEKMEQDLLKFLVEGKKYYESGQLKEERLFKNGVLDGEVKNYYESGQLKQEGLFKNGVRDGEYKLYNEDKIMIEKGKYCNDVRCGVVQLFYPDSGELNTEGEYIKGKKEGKFTLYFKKGAVCATFIYKNDKLISGKSRIGRKYNRAELVNWENTLTANCN